MENFGYFLFTTGRTILELGDRLWQVLTQSVNISFVSKIFSFFGSDLNIPSEISLMWILTGGSVALLLLFIILKVVL